MNVTLNEPQPTPTPPPTFADVWATLTAWLNRSPLVQAGGVLTGYTWSAYKVLCGAVYYSLPVVLGTVLAVHQGCTLPVPPVPPPTPPAPVPPTPPPVSPLQQSLQTAYNQETGTDKATATATLGELLSAIIPQAKASGKVQTAGALQTLVKAATDLAIGKDAIPKVRLAVGAYIASTLPTAPDTVADATYWAKAADTYSAVGTAFKGVH